MPTSEARIRANQLNALQSTGPKTAEGKEQSRRNALKHGLTGQGIVLVDEDTAEVERRHEALLRELAPKSELGAILILKIATTSVRAERSSRHEFAATAERVRHAAETFDEARVIRAEALLAGLPDNPRGNLRRLRSTIEGMTLLIENWCNLLSDVSRPLKPLWTPAHLVKAANLLGIKESEAGRSRLGVLSDAIWGDFSGLGPTEGGHLGDEARKGWARGKVAELIDQTFAELEEHAGTIDRDLVQADRDEAGDRALFDDSKAATLARRYDSEANRGFYKALSQFHKAEADAAERNPAPTTLPPLPADEPPPPPPSPSPSPLGSFRASQPGPDRDSMGMAFEPTRPTSAGVSIPDEVARGADGRPLTLGKGASPTT